MGIEFHFTGLIGKMSNLDKKVQNEITVKAFTKAAENVKEELKKEVELRAYDTGDLYRSIGVSPVKLGYGGKKMIYVGSITNDESIRARLYYNEYGTDRIIGKKLLKRTAERTREKSTDIITETIQEELNKL